MEMKSFPSYPPPRTPPPQYSSTMPYPGPHPSSYGYPDPTSSGTPNHPVAPPTTEIGFGEVHRVEPNHESSLMVVVSKYKHPCPKTQCCFASVFLLISIIAAAFIVVKFLYVEGVLQ